MKLKLKQVFFPGKKQLLSTWSGGAPYKYNVNELQTSFTLRPTPFTFYKGRRLQVYLSCTAELCTQSSSFSNKVIFKLASSQAITFSPEVSNDILILILLSHLRASCWILHIRLWGAGKLCKSGVIIEEMYFAASHSSIQIRRMKILFGRNEERNLVLRVSTLNANCMQYG